MRIINLFNFFSNPKNKYILKEKNNNFIILIIVLSMVYWFRLPSETEENKNYREEFYYNFQYNLNKFIDESNQLQNKNVLKNLKLDMKKIINSQLEYFYSLLEKNNVIPNGIAKTQALMENIFCIFVCLQSKTPLFIIGPPGI
jgi:hypothetical protein